MNFLKEFTYKPEQGEIMSSVINGALDILKANVDEVDRNINLSNLLTYKRIQFQRIDITNIAYSLNSLLNNSQVISLIGGDRNTSMSKRLEMWNSMNAIEQANILDLAGYYLEFTDDILSTITDDLRKRRFDIVDFELCDLENNTLIRNVDYVFYDNKLMLLKEFLDSSSNYKKKYLIMKNVVVDIGLTENVLGGFMHMPSNKELTKVEYNEILKGFTASASKGPIIGEYRTALNRYKSLEGVRVYDKVNADATRRHFWGTGDKIGDFTNFDFIVSMPVQLVYKPEKLDYIINFFNQTKPAYANFVFSPELPITDIIPMKAKATLFKTSGSMTGIKDKLPHSEVKKGFLTIDFRDVCQILFTRENEINYVSDRNNHVDYISMTDYTKYLVKSVISNISDYLSHRVDTTKYFNRAKMNDEIESNNTLYMNGSHIYGDRIVRSKMRWDKYRLDEDYFDIQIIDDPVFSKVTELISDTMEVGKSKISLLPNQEITDKQSYSESNIKRGEISFRDISKVLMKDSDENYVLDGEDYLDTMVMIDDIKLLQKQLIAEVSDNINRIEDITFDTVEKIEDNIDSKTLISMSASPSYMDKVYTYRLGSDAYILDQDEFDWQVIDDPIHLRNLHVLGDILKHGTSKITLSGEDRIHEKVKHKEKITNNLGNGFYDRIKVIKASGPVDDSYKTDERDRVDMPAIVDPTEITIIGKMKTPIDLLINPKSLINRSSKKVIIDKVAHKNSLRSLASIDFTKKTDKIKSIEKLNVKSLANLKELFTNNIKNSGKVTILNAKNLYDRMSNEDISSKTITVPRRDNAYLSSKANVIECDSLFVCDYSEESCIVLDSVPDNYNIDVSADFVSREVITLELIPKN